MRRGSGNWQHYGRCSTGSHSDSHGTYRQQTHEVYYTFLLLQLKLKEKLSVYDYRMFLKVVHFHVFQLLEVNGGETSTRLVNKGDHKICKYKWYENNVININVNEHLYCCHNHVV